MSQAEKGSYSSVPKAENASKADDAICLKAKMGLVNGITVIVGSIIGSGIFVSPKGVLLNTGSVGLSLVVWISSGIFSMIGAFCYAELGCMITKSGADYAYIMESFGPFVAFLRLWVECMIVRPCSQAVVALTFSFYVLRPIFPDCEPPDASVRFLAVLCICKYIYLTFFFFFNILIIPFCREKKTDALTFLGVSWRICEGFFNRVQVRYQKFSTLEYLNGKRSWEK